MNYKSEDTCVRRLDFDCFNFEVIYNIHEDKNNGKDNNQTN